MKRSMGSIAKREGRGKLARRINFFALFVACLFLLCSALKVSPQTQAGLQCPTAPIQAIRVAVKDKCGCILGYKSVAPKPGDKGFVQCKCAEKKSAEHALPTPPKSELFVSMEPDPILTSRVTFALQPPAFKALIPASSRSPRTRPPAFS